MSALVFVARIILIVFSLQMMFSVVWFSSSQSQITLTLVGVLVFFCLSSSIPVGFLSKDNDFFGVSILKMNLILNIGGFLSQIMFSAHRVIRYSVEIQSAFGIIQIIVIACFSVLFVDNLHKSNNKKK